MQAHVDDLYHGDMVLLSYRWEIQEADFVVTGFVVGDPETGAAILRMDMDMDPPHRTECYLSIEVPAQGPEPKYEMVLTSTIRGIQLMGRGEAHKAAIEDFQAWAEEAEASP